MKLVVILPASLARTLTAKLKPAGAKKPAKPVSQDKGKRTGVKKPAKTEGTLNCL